MLFCLPLRNGGAPLGKWRGLTCQKQELKQGFWGYVVSMGFPGSNFQFHFCEHKSVGKVAPFRTPEAPSGPDFGKFGQFGAPHPQIGGFGGPKPPLLDPLFGPFNLRFSGPAKLVPLGVVILKGSDLFAKVWGVSSGEEGLFQDPEGYLGRREGIL